MTETTTGDYQQAFAQVEEMLQAREFMLALTQIEAILEVHPRDVKTNYLKGFTLRNLGRLPEAATLLQQLSRGTTGVARIDHELGLTLQAMGRVDEAIDSFRAAVKIDPKLADSWQRLGEMLSRQEDEDGSEAEQAFRNALAARHVHPGIIKALDLIRDERYGMAEGICRDYLQRHPEDVSVIRLLAEIGIKLGVREDPEILLEQCLEMAPGYHQARNTYANALGKAHRYEEALKEIDYLEQVEPNNLSHSVLAASIQVMIGDYEQAAERYKNLVGRVPNHAQLQNSYGHALKTLGRGQEAIKAYRSAIEIRESLGDAYWNLANLKTFKFENHEIDKMRAVIAGGEYSPSDYYHLCFALGKALEDRTEYDEAYGYYELGNASKSKLVGYDAELTTAETSSLIKTCNSELISAKSGYGSQAADPIFIVGLPRSGSTLLEQILASHSQVDGTSELREMISIARRLGGKRNRGDESKYPGILSDLTRSECLALGEEYLERTRIQRGDAPFFIDKMPNNFQHVALISQILPNAKIIDARRHPMATCFSGFKQLFAGGQTFTYSQTDIARYYRDYVALMAHWDEVLPGKVLCVKYENVIADIETQVRRILDYCGLPFEEECLAFHNTQRSIRTASSEQVRQPLYATGVDQWRHFEGYLSPMREQLGELISAHEAM